tara:strand:+ start:6758 stop:7819 length:1062 start_codon:yes stop_codon:yes gene_type:complete
MAVKWSWPFGPETAEELETIGWDAQYVSPVYTTSSTSPVYTYPGSPERYSLNLYRDNIVKAPPSVVGASGWVAVAFYCSDTFDSWYRDRHIISIKDENNKAIAIYCSVDDTQNVGLRVGDTDDPSGSFTVSQNDWHYVALQYDMTSSVWSARWYLDGAPMGSLTSDASEDPATEDQLTLSIAGMSNLNGLKTWYGQIVTWDDKLGDSGAVSRYATRVQLGKDTATAGSWSPSVGTDNFAVLSGTMVTGTYVQNTAATIGNFLTCQISASAGLSLANQLGTTPASINGVTAHGLVSGSGPYGLFALGDNNIDWSRGSTVLPTIADPKYGYATAVTGGSGVWSGTSTVYLKYEVS